MDVDGTSKGRSGWRDSRSWHCDSVSAAAARGTCSASAIKIMVSLVNGVLVWCGAVLSNINNMYVVQ